MIASLLHRGTRGSTKAIAILALIVVIALSAASQAQPPELADKPFADHRIVLQLSDRDDGKQALVLSVANNLLKAYDPDKIAIEVVAFGPGVKLLFADSANRERVDSLIAQGVRFDICMNTIDTIERESGTKPKLNPKAIPVQVGVGQILSLVEKGFTLVRP